MVNRPEEVPMGLVACTLAMVVAADLLLWGARLGVSAALAGGLAVALTCAAWPAAAADRAGKSLLAWAVLSSASMAFEPGPIGALSCAVAIIALAARGAWPGPLPLAAIASVLVFPVTAPAAIVRDARGNWARAPGILGRPVSWRGWVVPACIALVFAGLFGAGDAAFARTVLTPFRMLADMRLPSGLRAAWWLVVLTVGWGLMRARVPATLRADVERIAALEQPPARLVTASLVTRCLVLVHAVFTLENILGIRHAWLGVPLGSGVVLSDAARHGFGALVIAALLSAALVLIAFAPGSDVERDPVARRLAILWMGQVALLIVTAMLRLHVYVGEYSLTRSRVAAAFGIALVGACTLLLLMRLALRRSNSWLVSGTSLATVVAILVAAFSDIDGAIARFNVRNCLEVAARGTSLDVAYLESLGPDTLPALLESVESFKSWSKAEDACRRMAQEVLASPEDPRSSSVRRRVIIDAARRTLQVPRNGSGS